MRISTTVTEQLAAVVRAAHLHDSGNGAAGQTGNQNDGANRVIGVTSYGRIGLKFKVQGSSILDERFTKLLNAACARRQGNC